MHLEYSKYAALWGLKFLQVLTGLFLALGSAASYASSRIYRQFGLSARV